MTSNMSAACATSSVIAVEGVSGEIATPAFMFRAWMASMSERGSARELPLLCQFRDKHYGITEDLTGCFVVEAV